MKMIKKNQSGFTMIEVMIVLAIAAIVLVGVLVAAQALQRSGRNQARRADVGAMHAWLIDYKAKKGDFPDTGTHKNQNLLLGGVKLDSLQHYNELTTGGTESKDIIIATGHNGPTYSGGEWAEKVGTATPAFKDLDPSSTTGDGNKLPETIDQLFILTGWKCIEPSIETGVLKTALMEEDLSTNAIIYALEGDDLVYCQHG